MIKSMTGFAKGEVKTKKGVFTSEIRSLNHKFLEITYKLPNSFAIFDDRVKALVKNKLKRGKIYLNFSYEAGDSDSGNVFVDEALAKSYASKLIKLRKRLNLDGKIKLSDVVAFPGVVCHRLNHGNVSKMWLPIKEVISCALLKLNKDREREGSFLLRDFVKRIKKIQKIVLHIKKNASTNIENYKKRLQKRVKELSSGYALDKGRLEVEVAIFAKNSDITEELTRLTNHIQNFTKTLKKSGEVGKKLDFIAQELHREINTVGSKSSGFNISKGVIESKTEIEKIREQLKNIE